MAKRASSGYTHANCHGCGQPPTSYGGRLKDQVCRDCRELINFAKKMHTHQQSLETVKAYTMPDRLHDLPRLPHCRAFDGPKDVIQSGFHTLLKLVSAPSDWESNADFVIEPTPHVGYTHTIRMSPLVREQINLLYNTFIVALNEAYTEGKGDGERFITALAKGEVSIDRFNDAVTRK